MLGRGSQPAEALVVVLFDVIVKLEELVVAVELVVPLLVVDDLELVVPLLVVDDLELVVPLLVVDDVELTSVSSAVPEIELKSLDGPFAIV